MNCQGRSFPLVLAAFKRLCSTQPSASPSALFVPSKYCKTVTPTVIPYYDLKDLNVEKMRVNLNARELGNRDNVLEKIAQSSKELESIEEKLDFVSAQKECLSAKLQAAAASSNGKKESFDEKKDEIEKEFALCKKASKELNDIKWEIEEECVLKYLDLPNRLHPDTPTSGGDVVVIHSRKDKPELTVSHQDLCKDEDELLITQHGAYMSGRLAHLELTLSALVQDRMLEAGFEAVCGTDFARSVIVEGCHPGSEVVGAGAARHAYPIAAESSDVTDVHGGMGLHLVGSASIYPFVGQLVKNVVINRNALPLRQLSVGRKYTPNLSQAGKKPSSLFEVPQTSAVEVFTASCSEQEMESQFDSLVATLKTIYDELDCHYRMVLAPANQLGHAQSKRLVVQMAAAGGAYVDVGDVVVYGDFLSKRLMLLYQVEEPSLSFKDLQIVSGTMINVNKAIGCLIENGHQWTHYP